MARKFMPILVLAICNVIIVKSVNPITTITVGEINTDDTKSINWQKILGELTVNSVATNFMKVILDKFHLQMPYGIPYLGIPVLEPFKLKEGVFKSENAQTGRFKLEMKDVVLKNLSTFVVDKASLSVPGPTIALVLSVPKIFANGFYNLSLQLKNGTSGDESESGCFKMLVHDFKAYVHAILDYAGNLYLKSLDLDFSLKSIDLKFKDSMGNKSTADDEKVLKQIIPEVVEYLKPEILRKIEDYLAGAINETIYHHTTQELFNVMADLLALS